MIILYERNFFFINEFLLYELGFNRSRKPVSLIQIIDVAALEELKQLPQDKEIKIRLRTRYGDQKHFLAARYLLDFGDTKYEVFLLTHEDEINHYRTVLNAILDEFPIPSILMNEQKQIIYLNDAFKQQEVMLPPIRRDYLNISDLFSGSSAITKIDFTQPDFSHNQMIVESRNLKKYHLQLFPLRMDQKNLLGVLGIFREHNGEVTPSAKINYRPVGIFTGTAIQNFNNFLNIIAAHTDLMIHKYPERDELAIIKGQVKRIRILLNQLQFKSDNYRFDELRDINLNSLIINEVEIFKANNFFKNRVRLNLKLAENLPTIRGNYAQLSHAFVQLIQNAIEAMYQCKQAKLQIVTEYDNQNVYCSVIDNGSGIPAVILDKIFEPFYSTKSREPSGESGQYHPGLGLYWVDDALRQISGRCKVESQVEKGTTFSIIIPLAAPHHQ